MAPIRNTVSLFPNSLGAVFVPRQPLGGVQFLQGQQASGGGPFQQAGQQDIKILNPAFAGLRIFLP